MTAAHHQAKIVAGAITLAAAVMTTAALPATARTPSPRHLPRGSASSGQAHLRSAHGVTVRRVQRVGARQLQVTVVPRALRRPIGVRIVLPAHYRAHPRHRYPALYLFPGTSGHSTDWTTVGDLAATTRHRRLITVSSDIGFDGDGGGWFTNWVDRHTALGPSQWERYDIHELIPWIDANLATIRARTGRAVAGLSQGGYGATELAARHPDLFTQVGSFSGAPEIDRDADVRAGATLVIAGTMMGLNGVEPDAPFGSHADDEINWQGHDPAQLIDNLRGIGLWLATADGLPGKYDDPVTNPTGVAAAGAVESLTHVSTYRFHQHLVAQHVPSVVYDYGSGTHTWPYWARDLRRFMPVLMHRFAHPPRRGAAHYTTIEPAWSQFGWQVHVHRAQRLAFSSLTHATPRGFRLAGSGRAEVRTPGDYRPGSAYRVSVGSATSTIHADRHGRLRITVPFGPKPRRQMVRIRRAG